MRSAAALTKYRDLQEGAFSGRGGPFKAHPPPAWNLFMKKAVVFTVFFMKF